MILGLAKWKGEGEIMMWYYNKKGKLVYYYSGDGFTAPSLNRNMNEVREREAYHNTIIHDDGEE